MSPLRSVTKKRRVLSASAQTTNTAIGPPITMPQNHRQNLLTPASRRRAYAAVWLQRVRADRISGSL